MRACVRGVCVCVSGGGRGGGWVPNFQEESAQCFFNSEDSVAISFVPGICKQLYRQLTCRMEGRQAGGIRFLDSESFLSLFIFYPSQVIILCHSCSWGDCDFYNG